MKSRQNRYTVGNILIVGISRVETIESGYMRVYRKGELSPRVKEMRHVTPGTGKQQLYANSLGSDWQRAGRGCRKQFVARQ